MVLVPQPVLRALITEAVPGGAGIAIFVAALFAVILAVFWLYMAFAAVTWGRSFGMYLLDLGLEAPTKPTLPEALGWALGWTIALVPALLGMSAAYHPERGLPARLGGVPTRSTQQPPAA